ncbi:IclR family transcriptional regulator [Ketogulonicigenium vulgare]|uniref:IclR family transcriptional regulator n=1 Tax=Ketogulonicigenium vulgare (strain WSH-001) TaxID=759362 RepID=F9Y4Q2_KETVW|nr:IclR family transcriptional regulator [Ketogulonicigenium vulgare]ADO42408.1 IclR family transcriptional regulator [Ketogulonicigenium vulgare Y25]AEM40609.1 IclR family transcriptional regulator [Ketogulonicigenium vulgare WSH-001]ALJ82295.1 IclR family transcriptional regulator [Ketogulonicigenium vulgare]ANW33569.1 IclR family transcriptional regulator [Ketogulonicigenium vulgare]AOZ54320.1 IclR family transcriptional regulator [Ketogulonicigenium vulgare]
MMDEFELFPEEDPETGGGKRSPMIQSVSFAARFLKVMAEAGSSLPLSELARQAGTGRSTAHRYLQSLVKEGLARQDRATGHYDLGPMALTIGIAALKRTDAIEVAAQHTRDLALQHGLSAGVAIWTDRGPVLVRWYRNVYFAINPLVLGDILPLDNTACGLVFQAFLPPAAVQAARANQPETFRGTPPDAPTLETIRQTGWAEKTSHLLPNVTGQAAPVFDVQGELVCVMTTVTDLGRLAHPEDRMALLAEAKRVNAALGAAIP